MESLLIVVKLIFGFVLVCLGFILSIITLSLTAILYGIHSFNFTQQEILSGVISLILIISFELEGWSILTNHHRAMKNKTLSRFTKRHVEDDAQNETTLKV